MILYVFHIALVFGVSADTGLPRLLSLGKDMNLVYILALD